MLLSLTAKYALRLAVFMASKPDRNLLKAKDLARETNIPTHYVSKILRRMVTAGLLFAEKGHKGGFRLLRSPVKTTFLEVLSAVQGGSGYDNCVFNFGKCDCKNPCMLHSHWNELNKSFLVWARKSTLGSFSSTLNRRES